MRRREDVREPMRKLTALTVVWFDKRDDERRQDLVLRELGRIPDIRDIDEAYRVLADLDHQGA